MDDLIFGISLPCAGPLSLGRGREAMTYGCGARTQLTSMSAVVSQWPNW